MAEVRPTALQKQLDGSTWASENCAAASAAMTALRAKRNVNPKLGYPWLTTSLPTMSSATRKWCNAHYNTSVVDGLYQKWVNPAVKAMYGVSMGYAFGTNWSTLIAYLLDHRGITVTVMYSYFQGTPYAGSSFRGRHRQYWNERRWNATKQRMEILVYDPLCDGRHPWIPKGPQWIPVSKLRQAAEAAGIEISFTPRTA
jgi:hypothetical protein